PPQSRAQAKALAGITLGEFAERWLAHRDLTPKTHALYRDLLKSRILPQPGDQALRALTPAQVRSWWAGLGEGHPHQEHARLSASQGHLQHGPRGQADRGEPVSDQVGGQATEAP